MINAIIVDDNKDLGISLFNYLNDTEDIRIIKYLTNGTNVIKEVNKLKPDIILLDLKMPGMNGLQVIERLEENNENNTKVIVYSGEDKYISRISNAECVIGVINKSCSFESLKRQFIEIAKNINNKTLKQQSTEFLLDLGFSMSNKGTYFLRDCICMFLIQRKDECVVKQLFRKVADINNLPASYIVKNNIHTATKVAWNSGDREFIISKLKLGATEEISPKKVITMAKYYIDLD